jgi:flagellar basal body P-ring formation protein FlgA
MLRPLKTTLFALSLAAGLLCAPGSPRAQQSDLAPAPGLQALPVQTAPAPGAAEQSGAAPTGEKPAKAIAGARIVVRVLPHSEVPGDEFTLGEVSELDGTDLAAVRRLAGVSLGRSPLPGRSLWLNEPFIRGRLAQSDGAQRVQIEVPPGADVARAAQTIPGSDIAARVLAYAQEHSGASEGELEQDLAVPISDAVLPLGEVAWKVEPLGRYLAAGGARTYRVTAAVHGEEVWRGIVRVNQQVYRKVIVAARPVRRNQIIRPDDVVLERKPIMGVKDEAYLTRTTEVVGARAKRPIGKGEWISKLMLDAVADVAEGGPVTLVYETEQVRFTSPGVAMVPAKVGEFIPVRNLESGKIVYGVVQPQDVVKVN